MFCQNCDKYEPGAGFYCSACKPKVGYSVNPVGPVLVALSAVLIFFLWPESVRRHPPGVLVPSQPIQRNISRGEKWKHKGFLITPLATFDMEGLVILKKTFWSGKEADLAPIDLTFAWGEMSNQAVIDKINFSHPGRFYKWYTDDEPPLPKRTINDNVANMHLVPADDEILRELKSVVEGDIVELGGYLIRADIPDGWHWVSSLTRTDSGAGACEIIWVEEVSIR